MATLWTTWSSWRQSTSIPQTPPSFSLVTVLRSVCLNTTSTYYFLPNSSVVITEMISFLIVSQIYWDCNQAVPQLWHRLQDSWTWYRWTHQSRGWRSGHSPFLGIWQWRRGWWQSCNWEVWQAWEGAFHCSIVKPFEERWFVWLNKFFFISLAGGFC